MKGRFLQAGFLVVGLFCAPGTGAQSDAANENASTPANVPTELPPDLRLLEFIAEFGDLDDNSFNLILEHALADEEQSQPADQSENNDAK